MSVPDDVRRSLWQIGLVPDTGSRGCEMRSP